MSEFFVIYDHPKDFPDHYVMRRWETDDSPEGIHATQWYATALNENVFREQLLVSGYYRIPRKETDDPVIMETWAMLKEDWVEIGKVTDVQLKLGELSKMSDSDLSPLDCVHLESHMVTSLYLSPEIFTFLFPGKGYPWVDPLPSWDPMNAGTISEQCSL